MPHFDRGTDEQWWTAMHELAEEVADREVTAARPDAVDPDLPYPTLSAYLETRAAALRATTQETPDAH
jgi:hypothetical protein